VLTDTIRSAITEHGKLAVDVAALHDDADLYDAGLTSLSTVTVMLALEDALELEFPESMLSRRTFSSVATIRSALEELLVAS
jgi:acyl carrier protein